MKTQLEMTSKWEESFNGVCTVPLCPYNLEEYRKYQTIVILKKTT